MRQAQNAKRVRGRGRKVVNQMNRVMDSNGPDVKLRGTPSHIYDKYQTLARDANSSGDRVMAENYLQHAEHYLRVINALQTANAQAQPGQPQPAMPRSGDAAPEGANDDASQQEEAPAAAPAKPARAPRQPRAANGRGRRRTTAAAQEAGADGAEADSKKAEAKQPELSLSDGDAEPSEALA